MPGDAAAQPVWPKMPSAAGQPEDVRQMVAEPPFDDCHLPVTSIAGIVLCVALLTDLVLILLRRTKRRSVFFLSGAIALPVLAVAGIAWRMTSAFGTVATNPGLGAADLAAEICTAMVGHIWMLWGTLLVLPLGIYLVLMTGDRPAKADAPQMGDAGAGVRKEC